MALTHLVPGGADHAGPFLGAVIYVVFLLITLCLVIDDVGKASLDLSDDPVEVIVDRDPERVDLLLVLEELLAQDHCYQHYYI